MSENLQKKGRDFIDTNKELNHRLFLQRENDTNHSPYENELIFYELVRDGDQKKIIELMDKTPLNDPEGRGRLSLDEVRNIKYHFIVAAAMISRFCMEGGMNSETAYSLSDLYIQKADICTSIEPLIELHRSMCSDYAGRMRQLQRNTVYSKHVVLCIDYIYENLQKRITVSTLAKYVKRNNTYLSKLFRTETGKSVSGYIRDKKVEAAQNMLKYSDFSCLNIGNYLAFSSQSHFIQVFKAKTGLTPDAYRRQHFRSNWNKE